MWKWDDLTDELFESGKLRTRLWLNGSIVEISACDSTEKGRSRIVAANSLIWRLRELRRISIGAKSHG